MPKFDGGLLNCWQQTARKHGFIEERKKPCKNGICLVGENEKKKMRKESWKKCINKV